LPIGIGRFAKAAVGYLALVVAGAAAGIVMIEFVVGLAPGILPAGVRKLDQIHRLDLHFFNNWAADEYLGYRPRPDSELREVIEDREFRQRFVRLGSTDIGVRDMGIPLEPADAIVVGDSFTFCDGVSMEECWVRLLSDETGRGFINFGVPGYSAVQETRVMARYGIPLHPRVILSAIFLNDFTENLQFEEWLREGRGNYLLSIRSRRLGPLLSRCVDFLEQHSVVYRLFRRTVAAEHGIRRWRGRNGEIGFSPGGWWRGIVDIDARDQRWQVMRETLLEQQRLATSIHAQLVVLLMPFKEQAYWHIVKDFAACRDHCDPDRPYRLVAELCQAEHIPVLDLTETFRRHARENEVLYFNDDAHWNAAGNALAARTVAAFLRDRGLVPQ
jgi:hypothetical protein